MKILICSKLFYPSNDIGAVRPSNFAKYLARIGHEVTVITEKKQDNGAIGFQGIEIIRISNSKTIKCLINRVQNHLSGNNAKKSNDRYALSQNVQKNHKWPIFINIKKFFNGSCLQIYVLVIEIDWFIKAIRAIKYKYNKNSIDIVISSFGPFGSYLLGYFVSKSRIARHWISDLRDNMPDIFLPSWLNIIYKAAEKRMVHRADAITFVSQGQASMFRKSLKNISYDNNKIYIIYNGYENIIKPVQYQKKDKILRFSYTGQLYSSLRNFGLLFKVLNDLITKQLIDSNAIVLYYAGQESKAFLEQLYPFDAVKKSCQDLGFVNKKVALEIQNKSDILVALTWNTNTHQGVLTGKFMEYLQAYKPLISLSNGNLPNGELSQMVDKLNLGISCEYVSFDKDYIRLTDYILLQYNRIQEGKPLLFEPDIEGIQKFHYEKLTSELNDICIFIDKGINSKYEL